MSRLDDLREKASDLLDADDDLLIEVVDELDNYNGYADGWRGYPMGFLEELYGEMRLTDFIGKLVKNEFDVSDDYFIETIYGLTSTNDLAGHYRDNTDNDEIIDRILVTPRFSVSDNSFMDLIDEIQDYDGSENESKSVPKKSVVAKILEGQDLRQAISEASSNPAWDMSMTGDKSFKERVLGWYDGSENSDVFLSDYKEGPEKDGMPEYIDVRQESVDQDGNGIQAAVSYKRFYPDGSVKCIDKSEFGW